MWQHELNLPKQKMYTKFKMISFSLKKVIEKGRQDDYITEETSKTWSEEAIDTLINCFHSHECTWNVNSGNYKDQNRKSLALEEFDSYVSARI